jgi:hypothetical protein
MKTPSACWRPRFRAGGVSAAIARAPSQAALRYKSIRVQRVTTMALRRLFAAAPPMALRLPALAVARVPVFPVVASLRLRRFSGQELSDEVIEARKFVKSFTVKDIPRGQHRRASPRLGAALHRVILLEAATAALRMDEGAEGTVVCTRADKFAVSYSRSSGPGGQNVNKGTPNA